MNMIHIDKNENKISMIMQRVACDLYYNYVSNKMYNAVNNGIPTSISSRISNMLEEHLRGYK